MVYDSTSAFILYIILGGTSYFVDKSRNVIVLSLRYHLILLLLLYGTVLQEYCITLEGWLSYFLEENSTKVFKFKHLSLIFSFG